MSRRRSIPFDILDSIRGIAALYVAIAHCRGILWMGGSEFTRLFPRSGWGLQGYLVVGSSMLTRLAVEFVIVFFVLSGFSIAHSLSAKTTTGEFYKRRIIRIYPSYIVALAWAGLVFLTTRHFFPQWYDGTMLEFSFQRTVQMNDFFSPVVVVKNLLYMPSQGFITPFWSLTYEVIFYAFAPFLVRRVRLYLGVSVALFLLNSLSPGLVDAMHLPPYLHEFVFVYGIYFAFGVALYTYLDDVQRRLASVPKWLHRAIVLACLGAMYGINLLHHGESALGFVASALFSVALILYFLRYQVRIPALITIGKFSYTLYITHVASVYLYLGAYWAIARPTTQYIASYVVWPPAVAFVLLIAAAQYYFVELHTKKALVALRAKSASTNALQP